MAVSINILPLHPYSKQFDKSMLTKTSNDLAKSRRLVGLLKQQIEQGNTDLSEELDKANERISMLYEDFMTYLRERLGPVMLECIRQCVYTQNDESRIVVRSRESKEDKFKRHLGAENIVFTGAPNLHTSCA